VPRDASSTSARAADDYFAADAPALVVVSPGDAVSVKAESFASTVLLDPE
jgi:hypothetical protein